MRRHLAAVLLAGSSLLTTCLATPVGPFEPVGDPDDDARDALGPRVLLLAVPQSSLAGVLGAVIVPETGAPLTTRSLLVPRTSTSLESIGYTGVRELSLSAGVAVDLLGDLGAAAEHVTHVSYDVRINELTYLVGDPLYDAGSRCCDADGSADASCAAGYVTRAYVGTGTLRYLSAGSADAWADGPVEVHAGVSYRVARERQFFRSLFAVELADTDALCEHALCDERSAGGACERCRVLGAQSELRSLTAPADAALRVVCEGMRASASAQIDVRGDVRVEDCGTQAVASLRIRSYGADEQALEMASSEGSISPLTFARRTEPVRASAGGVLWAELDLVDCRCGGAPARCELASDLELAIETTPAR